MDTHSLGSVDVINVVDSSSSPKPRSSAATVDRGYSWVIMVATLVTAFLQMSVISANTFWFQEYVVRFDINAATVGWVFGLSVSARFLASPIIGLLYQKFSMRTIAVAGSALNTLAVLCYAFATELWMLYTGALLFGFGGCLVSMTVFIILPHYFDKRRGLAMGVTMCGVTTGMMIFPPLIERSLSRFGYTQTLVFLACVGAQTIVSTSLFRPQPKTSNATDLREEQTKTKWQHIKFKMGLNYLSNPLIICYMIVVSSMHVLYSVGHMFMSGLAMENTDLTMTEVATIISISAFCTYVKLPAGLCFDLKIVRTYRMYFCCVGLLLFGASGFALAFVTNKIMFAVCYVVFDVTNGICHSQHVTLLGDLVALKELPNAIALSRMFIGVAFLVGPAGVGRVKDYWDSFSYGFMLISSIHIIIVIGYSCLYLCWRMCKK